VVDAAEASMPDFEPVFQVLGPLAVERGGVEVRLGGPRQRLVLACLIVEAGRVVPAERLVDQVWGDDAPATGTGPLRTYVSQLRRLLAAPGPGDTLAGRPPGYLLDAAADQVDAAIFERRFAQARAEAAAGDTHRALATVDGALGLWRGPAFGDLADHPALRTEAVRLDQLRLAAVELRAELLVATGQHAQAAAELEALVRDNPLREHLWALLMSALYRSGRQGEALRRFQQARDQLVDQLGIEPGPELREAERAILRQDPIPGRHRRAPPTERPERSEPVPGRLPRQLTSFVGRVAERAMVADALAEARLVTLCGPGGAGKTRLAIAVAGELAGTDGFSGGARFVDLSAVSDPALVADAVAATCRTIGEARALVVLDNCEHVVDAAADAADALLARCPGARILATSRDELRLGGELVLRIGALGLPEPTGPAWPTGPAGPTERRLADAADTEIQRAEAVQLFLDRGRSVLAGFAPTGPALDLVARICRRLDGIPLAIELAAALVGSLPLAEIDARLDDRFRLLQVARRRAPSRQRTLRATLDWSFDLLGPHERDLFVRLGAFVGDFTLAAVEAVEAVAPPPGRPPVEHSLGHLVRASMVTAVSSPDGTDRFRLGETVRHYARERLDRLDRPEPGAAREVRSAHARHYAAVAAEAERHVHGPAAAEWLARVASELPNLRTAVAWSFSSGDLETGLRLAGSLRWFFARMGLLDELDRWLGEGLRRRDLAPDLRTRALTASTFLAFMRGDVGRSHRLGDEGVAAARQRGDARELAVALIARGGAAVYEGDLARAERCFDEGEDLCRRLGDRWGRGWTLTGRAVASRRAGRPGLAHRQARAALEIFRDLGDAPGQVLPLVNLALAAQEEGRLPEALVAARQAARLAAGAGDGQLQHTATCVLGRIELERGQWAPARDLLLSSVRDFPGAHHHHVVAVAIEGLAGLVARSGEHDVTVALLAFTAAMRDRWGVWLPDARRRQTDGWLAEARRVLGPERLHAEKERGRRLSLDDALALAEASTAAESPLAG
jgi:predicted ATPase/DNA-binding SARP family transcriptional activator